MFVVSFRSIRSFPIVSDRVRSCCIVTTKKGKPIALQLVSRLFDRSPKSPANILLPIHIGSKKKIQKRKQPDPISILIPRPDQIAIAYKKKQQRRSNLQESIVYTSFSCQKNKRSCIRLFSSRSIQSKKKQKSTIYDRSLASDNSAVLSGLERRKRSLSTRLGEPFCLAQCVAFRPPHCSSCLCSTVTRAPS
jgi:hypothetical protein